MSSGVDSGRISDSRDGTIRRRLARLVMLSLGSALVLVAVAFSAHELTAFRGSMQQHVAVLADVAARNSVAPLLFEDPFTAREILESLAADGHVVVVCLYDGEGLPFAHYARRDAHTDACSGPQPDGEKFVTGGFRVHRGVVYEGDRIGSLSVESDTGALTQLLKRSAGILLIVLAGASAASLALAARLQRQITAPIAGLVEGSGKLAEGDLSVSIPEDEKGELGALARAFANMAQRLRALIGGIQGSMGLLAEATGELQECVDQSAQDAAAQGQALSASVESTLRIGRSIAAVHERVEGLSREAGDTGQSISQMAAAVTQVSAHMDELGESIDGSASSVEEMIASVRSVAERLEPLHGATESTVASMDQLRRSVEGIEQNSEQSHRLTEQTAEEAQRGLESVAAAIEGMREIQESFEEVATAVTQLSEETDAIGEIVELIDDVTRETGMLALNADIIAAQAGEHGKAFSVVAQEVKSLADRTTKSAREIAGLVQSVQAGTRNVVSAVARGSARVEAGGERSNEASRILIGIGDSVRDSADRVRQIAEATQAQGDEIRSVERVLSELRSVVDQIRGAMSEQDRASRDISRSMESIRELGRDVTKVMQAQASDSRVIGRAFDDVMATIHATLDATREQAAEGERIREALDVFERTAGAATERTAALGRVAESLASRSQDLEREIGRFRL